MNTAIRFFNKKAFSYSLVNTIVARLNFTVPVLLVAVVFSALSVIYVTNLSRNFSADITHTRYENNQLRVDWDQLLLERSTLTMQSHVHRFAENHLNMVIPNSQSVVNLP